MPKGAAVVAKRLQKHDVSSSVRMEEHDISTSIQNRLTWKQEKQCQPETLFRALIGFVCLFVIQVCWLRTSR
jgi:hypothetical protein